MKKYILGFILGAVLFSGGIAFGKALLESRWYIVDRLEAENGYTFYEKIFDEDTNVVCYTVFGTSGSRGISCLKNN